MLTSWVSGTGGGRGGYNGFPGEIWRLLLRGITMRRQIHPAPKSNRNVTDWDSSKAKRECGNVLCPITVSAEPRAYQTPREKNGGVQVGFEDRRVGSDISQVV